MSDLADLLFRLRVTLIDTSIGKMFARVGGSGPPLLGLHGYPTDARHVAYVGADAGKAFHISDA